MTSFHIAPEAAQDIEEILRYIANDSILAAQKLQGQFLDMFRHLANFPNSGHLRRDLAADRDLLFFSSGKYLVLYRVKGKNIEIVAVLHSARDIPTILHHRGPGS